MNPCKDKFYANNLAEGSGSFGTLTTAVNQWYKEQDNHCQSGLYDSDDITQTMQSDSGHFTDLVWKSAKKVGIASLACDATGKTITSYLSDHGNDESMKDNVQKPNDGSCP